MSDDSRELIVELETQVHCSYGRGLSPPNPLLGYATDGIYSIRIWRKYLPRLVIPWNRCQNRDFSYFDGISIGTQDFQAKSGWLDSLDNIIDDFISKTNVGKNSSVILLQLWFIWYWTSLLRALDLVIRLVLPSVHVELKHDSIQKFKFGS